MLSQKNNYSFLSSRRGRTTRYRHWLFAFYHATINSHTGWFPDSHRLKWIHQSLSPSVVSSNWLNHLGSLISGSSWLDRIQRPSICLRHSKASWCCYHCRRVSNRLRSASNASTLHRSRSTVKKMNRTFSARHTIYRVKCPSKTASGFSTKNKKKLTTSWYNSSKKNSLDRKN